MIDRREILEAASSFSLLPSIVQKDYVLGWMLAGIYTHTSAEAERDAAIALERAIYGDLFPVVSNIENRNNFVALN